MARTQGIRDRKVKKSFTLSHETFEFLESVILKRRSESVSAILKEILQDVRRQHQRASVERAVADFYSSLSDSEVAEHARWGEFALEQVTSADSAQCSPL